MWQQPADPAAEKGQLKCWVRFCLCSYEFFCTHIHTNFIVGYHRGNCILTSEGGLLLEHIIRVYQVKFSFIIIILVVHGQKLFKVEPKEEW